ncbi:hypothetical protein CRG98_021501 [Punica granatum]|uniref:Uncharacterized protein n=1 Tax=Punica granatum TaxID=22663 RepID=A0A2I0JPC9_PUNGR|nr:hypothetical protein CRG98_021501 [Punica granatum]
MCEQEHEGLVPGRPSAEELRKQGPEPVWTSAAVQPWLGLTVEEECPPRESLMAEGRWPDGPLARALRALHYLSKHGSCSNVAFQCDDAGRTISRGGWRLGLRRWGWWRNFAQVCRGCACRGWWWRCMSHGRLIINRRRWSVFLGTSGLLLVFLYDFPAKTISLGPEVIELSLDSRIRGEECPRWSAGFGLWRVSEIFVCWGTPSIKAKDIFLSSMEFLFLMGRMLGEVRMLKDHCSPCGQDLFDVTLKIH